MLVLSLEMKISHARTYFNSTRFGERNLHSRFCPFGRRTRRTAILSEEQRGVQRRQRRRQPPARVLHDRGAHQQTHVAHLHQVPGWWRINSFPSVSRKNSLWCCKSSTSLEHPDSEVCKECKSPEIIGTGNWQKPQACIVISISRSPRKIF